MSRLTERIENFNRAYNIYVMAVDRYNQDSSDILNHMSLIQAFAHDTISNGELWIEMLETCNTTSHEYKMDKVNLMLEKISTIYFQEIKSFNEFAEKIG